ncbi:ubiquinol oxidase subunit II [Croceicoccus mobilis]|uniref:Ubiquinol oxidase polypeptide II n=1 Tax=Croceicoccus mobilis TaxID=1703339 RepID=A0A916YV28_9SPHN|nr:ubiquinol oxidase subunit II [Croceicoccus mobilis]GGD63392.1 cytochrome ubiquinol oxidase subunit II [Croceicoccus mobilis]
MTRSLIPQNRRKSWTYLRITSVTALAAALGGCGTVVLDPAGDVAQQQGDLVVHSTYLMLLIIIPVMAATAWFAWHYRASNKDAKYDPDWDHSTQLELLIWAAPLLIIIALGALTWVGTHLLDPYRPIERIDAATRVAEDQEPLTVEVVALDWKWLFIYPDQGIATVNELVVPTGRPLNFKITSATVMNSFYVPAMAGQIYAMPGMETKLHAVMNENVKSVGFSANYSGAGFPNMRFPLVSVSDEEFADWAGRVKAGADTSAFSDRDIENRGELTRAAYLELEKPSEADPTMHFGSVDPALYQAILNMCVAPGKLCQDEIMAMDARAAAGHAGEEGAGEDGEGHEMVSADLLTYDKYGRDKSVAITGNPSAEHMRELEKVRAKARAAVSAHHMQNMNKGADKPAMEGQEILPEAPTEAATAAASPTNSRN